eukprot:CAMPEP_0197671602 /NCGR_PEP_ID=MMETSP1338-20131121/77005_1 /TAXON_ID=43686 ORGANISM="Pelagodinium beii, Strain RCC1491" /NCGR_SAMPLE_ID=MMETSP1338 /ASSEMBLY_ACC=CAM_ASM_000754 /LENGTH=499 /DNA_ID=CAMNT_0043251529 /DNA_START=12 /DNA_END=1508 /DNA_ORIENTATION=-
MMDMMKVLLDYVSAAKVYAFPVAGVLLVIYPAALFVWTAIEGQAASSSAKKEQELLEKKSKPQDPFEALAKEQDKQKEANRAAERSQRRLKSSSVAVGAALAIFTAGRHLITTCFVGQVSPSEVSSKGGSFESVAKAPQIFTTSAQLTTLTDYRPAFAAFTCLAAAVGLSIRRAGMMSSNGRSACIFGRRGTGKTQCAALFAAASDVAAVFDRQISGPWSAQEAPESPTNANEMKESNESQATHSLWHDVSLYVLSWLDERTEFLQYVNEMPMGSLRKNEVQPGEPNNIILEDVKGSEKLAKFGRPVPFNYGCFPQTFRDPDKADELYSAPGDDDPLDVMDVTDVPTKVGAIVRCFPVGAMCLIDEGQADWKVLVVNVDADSPLAAARSMEDVERIKPGRIQEIWDWLYALKNAKGKGDATLHKKIHDSNCALKLIEEDHKSWKELVASAGPDGKARGHWIKMPDGTPEAVAPAQVLKLGWTPRTTVPGKIVRAPAQFA